MAVNPISIPGVSFAEFSERSTGDEKALGTGWEKTDSMSAEDVQVIGNKKRSMSAAVKAAGSCYGDG
jgi:hypothetical protein